MKTSLHGKGSARLPPANIEISFDENGCLLCKIRSGIPATAFLSALAKSYHQTKDFDAANLSERLARMVNVETTVNVQQIADFIPEIKALARSDDISTGRMWFLSLFAAINSCRG